MIVFVDCEFTGLGQQWPRLISLGLVSENGLEFYAELPPDTYADKVENWTRQNVLPLLDCGNCIMQPEVLSQHLTEWFEQFDKVQIGTDFGIDMDFLRELLIPWPANIDPVPLYLASSNFKEATERAYRSDPSLRPHHALEDARALCFGWKMVNMKFDAELPDN